MGTFNGWQNHKTWNVSLWVGNHEEFYRAALAAGKGISYREFATKYLLELSPGTPDGIAWLDDALDYESLDGMLLELHD
jgi:hypothetical protein